MRKDIAGAIQLTKTIVTAVVAQVTSPLTASLTCHQRSKLGFFRVLVESVTRSPCMLVEFHSPIIVPCHAHHVPLLLDPHRLALFHLPPLTLMSYTTQHRAIDVDPWELSDDPETDWDAEIL